MKNIIIVSINGDDNSGGVERVVYYLNKILSAYCSVSIMRRRGKPGKFDKIIYPVYFSLKLFFTGKNTVVISNSWQSYLFPADFSIHHGTTAGYLEHSGIRSMKSAFVAWMEKKSAANAKKIIAVGDNCGRELEKYYSADPRKIIVLNNFVDENLFYPEKSEPRDVIRILFSGRLEERKGLSKILSLAQTLQDTEGLELCMALNSSMNCDKFDGLKNVRIHKNLDINAMRGFYSQGDILYFPSVYEGFSMATLEALSSGIPVIGSSFAVPLELRKYDFAQVFEDDSGSLLIENIKRLCEKTRNRRGEIHAIIAKDFGCAQYAEKLLSIVRG
ncbi:MAG: glycosyltransferase family 4 protein [Treponema sp.]|nr:glycosyltransferase family 4 protein [Treponema sp.]